MRGLSRRRIVYSHALRNAAVPLVNLLGIQLSTLIGGVLVIEYIFDYPGPWQSHRGLRRRAATFPSSRASRSPPARSSCSSTSSSISWPISSTRGWSSEHVGQHSRGRRRRAGRGSHPLRSTAAFSQPPGAWRASASGLGIFVGLLLASAIYRTAPVADQRDQDDREGQVHSAAVPRRQMAAGFTRLAPTSSAATC